MTYANKDVYEGEWVDKKKQGRGIMTYYNGDVYDGEWNNKKKKKEQPKIYNDTII